MKGVDTTDNLPNGPELSTLRTPPTATVPVLGSCSSRPHTDPTSVQTTRTSTLILRSPHDHAKPILHINTDDLALTKRFVEAGQLLDIRVLDHLIIGRRTYVSMKQRGLGF